MSMTRNEVLIQACKQCLQELYSKAQPAVSWEDFEGQCELYSNQYKIWKQTRDTNPNYVGKTREECIGPSPYEFYYLPKEIFKDIADSYVRAYELDHQQNLLDIIDILKNYCENPIIDTYEPDEDGVSSRGYAHPDNLEKQIDKILIEFESVLESTNDSIEVSKAIKNKFFKFLDMAGDFYSWNGDLNAFNTGVYLGASPCSNKETVIKNWKIYRNQDIVIDESVYIDDEEVF